MPILKDLIIFLTVFISLNSLTNYYFQSVLKNYFLVQREIAFLNEQKNIKTLFIGDSHVLRGVDTKLIPDSYNYSSHAETYIHMYYRLKKYLEADQLPLLKIAILQMDPHCFTHEFNEQQYLPFMKSFIDSEELGKIKNKPIYYFFYYKVIARLAEYFGGLRIWLDSLFWKYSNNDNYKGYEAAKFNHNHTEKMLEETIDYHYSEKQISNEMILYFEKIIRLLESKGIKVAILNYPMCPQYRLLIPKETIRDFSQYKRLLVSQNKNLIVIDYHGMFFNDRSFIGTYFSDFNHLNIYGAKIMSLKLANDLSQI